MQSVEKVAFMHNMRDGGQTVNHGAILNTQLTKKVELDLLSCMEITPCKFHTEEQIAKEAAFHYKKGLEELNDVPKVVFYRRNEKG